MLRKHLGKLRTEENQISKILRKTKCKMTLKFHQFYSAKNMVRDTHKSRKPQEETEKKHLSQPETFFKTQRRSGASQHMTKTNHG